MGLKLFEIFFDDPHKVYLPGQTVSGRIKIIIDSPKNIRGVEFCGKGEAHVSFGRYETVRRHGKNESHHVTYEADEEYFRLNYYLVGGKGQEMELPAGEHIYPFTCVLPPVLPPSFEGSKGYIRYTIKATIDRPWKFDHDKKVAFTVIAPFDLNLNPRLKETVTMTMEKYFCCLWCKSGPLNVVVYLPQSGYVPGQTIPITCDVENASNVDINRIRFVLKQKIHFHSTRPSRLTESSEKEIASTTHTDAIHAKENGQFSEQIVVPSLPPSNLTNCSIIDLDYALEVVVEVSGFHASLTSVVPISIGTVPLNVGGSVVIPNANQNATIGWVPNPIVPTSQGGQPPYPPASGDAQQPYPSAVTAAPPSYDAAVGVATAPYPAAPSAPFLSKFEESMFSESEQPDAGFMPVYPVFTFPEKPKS